MEIQVECEKGREITLVIKSRDTFFASCCELVCRVGKIYII